MEPQRKRMVVSGLDSQEWNFDGVPESELEACCYWEYARESKFIQEAISRHNAWINAGAKKEYPDFEEIQRNYQRITLKIGVRAMVFVTRPDHFPDPWQSLDERERKKRTEYMVDERELFLITAVKLGDYDVLKQLREHCESEATKQAPRRDKWLADCQRELAGASASAFVKQQCESILKETDKKTRESLADGLLSWLRERCNLKGGRLPWPPPEPIRPGWPLPEPSKPGSFYGGGESLLLEINWSNYTDDAIAECFRKWVRENRPKSVPNPKKTGRTRKHDRRAALRDLGVMRLLHFSTVANLAHRCPAAADYYKRRGWLGTGREKEFSAARKRALRNFCTLFPFLPAEELPLCAHTKGGRGTQ